MVPAGRRSRSQFFTILTVSSIFRLHRGKPVGRDVAKRSTRRITPINLNSLGTFLHGPLSNLLQLSNLLYS